MHRHSARQITETSKDPGLYFVQDYHHQENRFDSHFTRVRRPLDCFHRYIHATEPRTFKEELSVLRSLQALTKSTRRNSIPLSASSGVSSFVRLATNGSARIQRSEMPGSSPLPTAFVIAFGVGLLAWFLGAVLVGLPFVRQLAQPSWIGYVLAASGVLVVVGNLLIAPSGPASNLAINLLSNMGPVHC